MNKIRKIILVAIWILALSCLYVFLFDPLTPYLNRQKLDALQVELNAAQEKWDLKNIRNYTYEVHYGSPMWGGCEAKMFFASENRLSRKFREDGQAQQTIKLDLILYR